MVKLVELGRSPTEAYDEYMRMNAVEAHLINEPKQTIVKHLSNIHQRRIKQYPRNPSNIVHLERCMEQNKDDGWLGSFWVQKECQYKDALRQCNDASLRTAVAQETNPDVLKDYYMKLQQEIQQKKTDAMLVRLRLCGLGTDRLKGVFYLASSQDGRKQYFGCKLSYMCGDDCDILCFDGTPDGFDMLWVVHGVKETYDATLQHESFPIFYILFAAGRGNHTELQYEDSLQFIVSYGVKHFGVDLSKKPHRALADFEQPERAAIVSQLNILNDKCEGCGYHWVCLIQNGLKRYGLWKLYISDPRFCCLCKNLQKIKDAPIGRVHEAYAIIYNAIGLYTPTEYVEAMQKFMNEYVDKQWMNGVYEQIEYNCFRKMLKHNNFAETQNKRLVAHLRTHPSWWPCVERLKEFHADVMLKYIQFKQFGHQRRKSKKEHLKMAGLNKLWGLIGREAIGLWDYLQGVTYVYDCKWEKFDEQFGAVSLSADLKWDD